MSRAAFVKQLFKHKNIGDVRVEGTEAEVRATFGMCTGQKGRGGT